MRGVSNAKKKRAKVMIEKIEQDMKLYEDEDDEEDNFEDEYVVASDDDLKFDEEGLVFPSSEDEEEDLIPFIARCKLQSYQYNEGALLKTRKKAPLKFTKGTDPGAKSLLSFVVDEAIACPQFLPLNNEDA